MRFCSAILPRCLCMCWSLILLSGCMQMSASDPPMKTTQTSVDSEALYDSMASGEWQKAHLEVSRQLTTSPKYALGYINLGIINEQLERPNEAFAAYTSALMLAPQNIAALNRLALLSRRQGDFSGAEQLYQRALGVNPEHAATHRNLGILYELYLGQFANAIEHYAACRRFSQQEDSQMTYWLQDLKRRHNQQISQPSVAGVDK
jgi:tetratricopeptide (TPR) repeat protein